MTAFEILRRHLILHRSELSALAGDPAFDRQLDNLAALWAEEDDPGVLWTETWRVVERFPTVRHALAEAGLEPAAHPTPPDAAGALAAPHARWRAAAPVAAAESPGGRRLQWPDREGITGVLAVLIVLTALTILVLSVFRVGDGEQAAAREALVFLNGVVGVVLGYYFGRAPAEARADAAEDLARRSQAELESTLGEVRGILASATGPGRGDQSVLAPEQLVRLNSLLNRGR